MHRAIDLETQPRDGLADLPFRREAMARDGRAGDMKTVTICIGGSREALRIVAIRIVADPDDGIVRAAHEPTDDGMQVFRFGAAHVGWH